MRRKTQLNLHRGKTRSTGIRKVNLKITASLWPDTFEEITGSLCSRTILNQERTPIANVSSPLKTGFTSKSKSRKRALPKSPVVNVKYKQISNTHTKSPQSKKLKTNIVKALLDNTENDGKLTEDQSDVHCLDEDLSQVEKIDHESQTVENEDKLKAVLVNTENDGKLTEDQSDVHYLHEDLSQVEKIEHEPQTVDNEDKFTSQIKEITDLLPSVLDKLSKEGFDKTILDFFRQVNSGCFPLKNIAFLLWTEVVKWFDCDNATFMRYSDETKKFWKLGYRTFGGRFIHFMSGFKNTDQVLSDTDEKRFASHKDSEINFAVPNLNSLRIYNPYDIENNDGICRTPGIFPDMIDSLSHAMKGKSCCLTFDGKKLKQGLSQNSGDVDLLGFEKGQSINDTANELANALEKVEQMMNSLSSVDEENDVHSLGTAEVNELKNFLLAHWKQISLQFFNIYDLKKKKEYAKEKLIERSGAENWKNGKYVHAISSLIGFLHDIDRFMKDALDVIEEITKCLCYINGERNVQGTEINLKKCESFVGIVDPIEDNPVTESNTRLIKQRSESWFNARATAKVTGSTLSKAIGLEGLNKQKEHFDSVICGMPEKEKSASLKYALDYGTENEQHATATIVGKVCPLLFPGCTVYEEGFVELGNVNDHPFLIVSPDGSVRTSNVENATVAGIELKCPLQKFHTEMPERYLVQCLSEIEALGVAELIYLSWRPDLSTVFKVKRNKNLFDRVLHLAETLYAVEAPKRQNKLSQETLAIKADIQLECSSGKSVEFIGIVQSIKNNENCATILETDNFRLGRTNLLLESIMKLIKNYYELRREPASEAVVFMVCDLDREWKENNIQCAPVCWFPKGYSLDTDTMRSILEAVLSACKCSGIHIPAISFDGQWHNICVRDADNAPLTLLQLHKNVWKQAERLTKTEILTKLKDINKKPEWITEIRHDNGKIGHVSPSGKRVITTINEEKHLPTISQGLIQQRIKENKTSAKQFNERQTNKNNDVLATHDERPIDEDIKNNDNEMNNTPQNEFISQCLQQTSTNTFSGKPKDPVNVQQTGYKYSSEQNVFFSTIILSENDAKSILTMFQTDKKCNSKHEWDNKFPADIQRLLTSYEKLSGLRDLEVRLIVWYINRMSMQHKIKESDNKQAKIEKLCKILGIENIQTRNKQKAISKHRQVKSLSELAFNILSRKLRKSDLNIIHAEFVWPGELRNWVEKYPVKVQYSELLQEENVQQQTHIYSDNQDLTQNFNNNYSSSSTGIKHENMENNTWFYSPAFSKNRQQLEVSCIDATHLMTRTRRKCCKGGLDGLSNDTWRKVAKSNCTSLSLAMIDGLLEPMSVSVAVSHFTESVEKEMRINGDDSAANLCSDIRQWWQAEDDPGIPACERIKLRRFLRNRLLSYVNFSQFPPPGMYINGWPSQLWEGIIAHIDAKAVLYTLSKQRSYNVRAFSSMMGETFFSELTLYDRRGQGTVSATEFGQFISSSIEKLHMRLDPSRVFAYRTSRKNVYKLVGRSDASNDHSEDAESSSLEMNKYVRDHAFDRPTRRRLKSKRKEGIVCTDRNALRKGTLGVRWEHARRDESKMLTTLRMGLDI